MSVVIRLSRTGRKNLPCYRINVADKRYPLDGRVLETIGLYDPIAKKPEMRMKVNVERASKWIAEGAELSDSVRSILKKLGVPMKAPAKKRDRSARKQVTATYTRRVSAEKLRAEHKAQRLSERRKAKKALRAAAAPAS